MRRTRRRGRNGGTRSLGRHRLARSRKNLSWTRCWSGGWNGSGVRSDRTARRNHRRGRHGGRGTSRLARRRFAGSFMTRRRGRGWMSGAADRRVNGTARQGRTNRRHGGGMNRSGLFRLGCRRLCLGHRSRRLGGRRLGRMRGRVRVPASSGQRFLLVRRRHLFRFVGSRHLFRREIRNIEPIQAPQPDRHIFIYRAGVRLLFSDAQFGKPVEYFMRLDFQLPGQLVNANLLHRENNLRLPAPPQPLPDPPRAFNLLCLYLPPNFQWENLRFLSYQNVPRFHPLRPRALRPGPIPARTAPRRFPDRIKTRCLRPALR